MLIVIAHHQSIYLAYPLKIYQTLTLVMLLMFLGLEDLSHYPSYVVKVAQVLLAFYVFLVNSVYNLLRYLGMFLKLFQSFDRNPNLQ